MMHDGMEDDTAEGGGGEDDGEENEEEEEEDFLDDLLRKRRAFTVSISTGDLRAQALIPQLMHDLSS
jgi:hypothetical protein